MINDSNYYSGKFKQRVIQEVLDGKLSKEEARRDYGILGHSTILKWIRKFEQADGSIITMTKEKANEDLSKEESMAKIKALEEALRLAEMKAAGYSIMIDIAEKELKVPIRKKPNTKRSKS